MVNTETQTGEIIQVGMAWRLVDVAVAPEGATFSFTLDRNKLRQVRRREGRYLLRTNLTETDPAKLWQFYLQLVEVEAARWPPAEKPRMPMRLGSRPKIGRAHV